MNERDSQDPLKDLGQRLDKARSARDRQGPASGGNAAEAGGNALASGWRIGIELLGAILVSTAIGWASDHWLGTRPWGIIVMFFLGVATGMVNVWRAVKGMGMAIGYRQTGGGAGGEKKEAWDDED